MSASTSPPSTSLYDQANVFSKISFWWLNNLVLRRSKDPVSEDALTLPVTDETELNYEIFQREWKEEKAKPKFALTFPI